jgi:hypothetical protein
MDIAKSLLAEILNETADILETGKLPAKIKIGITLLGSEHGSGEVLRGAELAQKKLDGVEVIVIGPGDLFTFLPKITAETEENCHCMMTKLLNEGRLDAAVTMHFNFPIGTATVGLAVAPGSGRSMFVASTTGTTSAHRVEGMVLNAISGIIAAKAYGIDDPSVGILNVDGSRQAERILYGLRDNGYPVRFACSQRSDGGTVMRGNDLLSGIPDVMVTDSLTGNLLMKMLSAFTTGGNYETVGNGYGPGVGPGFDKIIHIISRASGSPVIAGAIEYAAAMVKGRLPDIAGREFSAAKKAGLEELVKQITAKNTSPAKPKNIEPPKKPVSEQIAGIDVLELETAQAFLWQQSIYAETGMGCTGPVILVAPEDLAGAVKLLKDKHIL